MRATEPLLAVRDLRVVYASQEGPVQAVNGITFSVKQRSIVGIVGESGSGKSATCLSLLGLAGSRSTVTGAANWKGRNLIDLPPKALRRIRGREIAMVFQDPMSSLNPVHTVGAQLVEAVRLHTADSAKAAEQKALDILNAVEIPNARQRMHEYPHQFSGGMRQRVMIAMALLNGPDLLIADEPTTALDVTTQAQILLLLQKLQADFGTAIILITHDLGVVAEVADEVIVMYAGSIAEQGPVDAIFHSPEHPYTWGLLGSLPRLDQEADRLTQIPGQPPSLVRLPQGCPFHPRCAFRVERCSVQYPAPRSATVAGHDFACHLDEAARRQGRTELPDAGASGQTLTGPRGIGH